MKYQLTIFCSEKLKTTYRLYARYSKIGKLPNSSTNVFFSVCQFFCPFFLQVGRNKFQKQGGKFKALQVDANFKNFFKI